MNFLIPDGKKLTDAEIVKALECCIKPTSDCDNCPAHNVVDDENCFDVVKQGALNLINRQKAEIERLNKEVEYWRVETKEARADIDQAVAEAYKEFAERFKKKLSQKYTTSLWKVYCEEIDNLLKELIGE